jgi:hypothetical protein
MEGYLGKDWWQVKEQIYSEDMLKTFCIGTLCVSLFIRNKRAKTGASSFPIAFCFNETKATLNIAIAVYYETKNGDITRGSKENHYSAAFTQREMTEEEQEVEDAFLASSIKLSFEE